MSVNDGMLGGPTPKGEEDKPMAVRVQEAYENGASDVEICEIMRLTQGKFRSLYESNEGFHEAVDLGRVMSQAWWMKTGRRNLTNRTFNTSLWAFNMKNRFGWAEKTDNTTQDGAELSVEQMADKLSKMLPGTLSKLFPEKTQQQLLAMAKTEGGTQ